MMNNMNVTNAILLSILASLVGSTCGRALRPRAEIECYTRDYGFKCIEVYP